MNNVVHTRCCIAGGGPAGMMSALLLARIGVDVFVLEKHADFLRDFRGDTIHPSTLEIMYELGILEEFLKRPHQEVRELAGQVGEETVTRGDFTHLPTHCHFLALMPQWDFLNFVVEQARRYPTFHLKMQAEVSDLIVEQGVVVGAQAKTPDGNLEIRASLTIGADGRHSVIRRRAGLEVKNLGAPMDVMWMRIRRHPNDPVQTFGHIDRGRILVLINREDYWQCAFVIPKGTADEIRQRGLSSFREEVTSLAPFLSDRLQELRDWKDISVLTVAVDRLVQWSRAGVLSIGDAAHAMSPIGGGRHQSGHSGRSRNANLLGEKLLHGTPSEEELQIVQRRRRLPTWATQQIQITIQNRVIGRVLGRPRSLTLPWQLKLLRRWPILRRIPARLIGIGVRPEHVKTLEVTAIRETTAA
jgi:2-polyprenyl-6-methoxyphenol hydroxylase-like FAD-dependent oxidoreductase